MKLFSRLRSWFRVVLHRSRLESEMDAELRSHIESYADDLVRSGIPRAEAIRRARLEFGGIERVKEECRESRGIALAESLVQDLRFAFRMLRKSPGFTAVAILTLALGIGANTAIFSAVNGILLKPLPFPEANRLVELLNKDSGFSIPLVQDIQAQCPAFSEISVYQIGGGTMLGGSFPESISSPGVSGNYFTMLGVRPILGRPILPIDTSPGSNRVAVLSYALWQKDFGGDSKVVGKTVYFTSVQTAKKVRKVIRTPYQIIGVLPPYSNPTKAGSGVWIPLVVPPKMSSSRRARWFEAIARLRPGVTIAAANGQLKTLAARLGMAYPATDKGMELRAQSVKDRMVNGVRPELLILLTAVGFVLLIACVNISGMLLARSWTRQREVAIRAALGATRLRMLRQFLTESLLLSFAGGALGLLLARWIIPVLRTIAPAGTPRIENLSIDGNVLWFTLCASVLAGILFGLAPAIQISGRGPGAPFREGLGGSLAGGSSTRRVRRMRDALVVVEVGLAVTLVVGAALMARSLQALMGVSLGYRTDDVFSVTPDLSGSVCDYSHLEPCRLAAMEILSRIRKLSGVEAATIASTEPLGGGFAWPGIEVEGPKGRKRSDGLLFYRGIGPGYFRVMGIPLLAGRDFTDGDTSSSPRVTIVNRAFAQRFFQGANPLGQRISKEKDKKGNPEWIQVVGEVGDSRDFAMSQPSDIDPEYYLPETQTNADVTAPHFLVRTSLDPLTIVPAVKQQIWSISEEAPIGETTTMKQLVAREEATPKFRTLLLGSFGVLALLIATVGIYGVISYSAKQRTQEIGVRMALGAQSSDILRMILGEGMSLAAGGIGLGVGGALALTRFLRSLLFEIKPTDPATFVGVAILLAVVALLACYIPARRATKVDPMVALRYE
jgi:putative ABC transport system permease protein